jgi:hypothetical protein
MIRACAPTPQAAAAMYAGGFEKRPASIGCFLNLVTAMADLQLPSGKNVLDYYWNVCWPQGDPNTPAWIQQFDSVMKQDRFFCYVDQAILADVQAFLSWNGGNQFGTLNLTTGQAVNNGAVGGGFAGQIAGISALNLNAVPEPSTLAMCLTALFGLGYARRRRRTEKGATIA